jgi:hypothetical protein
LSVVVLASFSAYSLFQSLALASGSVAAAGALNRYFGSLEDRKLIKKGILDDIELERARLGRILGSVENGDAMMSELESIKDSLAASFDGGAESLEALDGFIALRQKIREAELDYEQYGARAEAIRKLTGELRASGIAVYEEALARLEENFKMADGLPPEERMVHLQGIVDELNEMRALESVASAASRADISALEERRLEAPPLRTSAEETKDPAPPADGGAQKKLKMVLEIRDFAGRIAMMESAEGEALRPMLENLSADTLFPDRLKRLHSQTKAKWGELRERTALSAFFRETLSDLMGALRESGASGGALDSGEGRALALRYEKTVSAPIIKREDAMALYESIALFMRSHADGETDALFIKKLESALSEMGYELLSDEGPEELTPDKAHYLISPFNGYKVMLRVSSGGELAVRLVRDAESGDAGSSESPAQAIRDLDVGGRFCGDVDRFLGRMSEMGFPLDVTVRREPGETEIMTAAVKNPPERKNRRGKRQAGEASRLFMRQDEDEAR